MRVIAGELRHRIIKETNLPTTRETQDRVREAIFNSIGPYFKDGIALDLFCGSGAMAIEAYSRGIKKIYLNDINRAAVAVSVDNLKNLGINNYEITNLDYKVFLKQCEVAFDYIFVDPPYIMNNTIELLSEITNCKVAKKGTLIIFEMARETLALVNEKTEIIKERNYGKKKVVFYEVIE